MSIKCGDLLRWYHMLHSECKIEVAIGCSYDDIRPYMTLTSNSLVLNYRNPVTHVFWSAGAKER